MKWGLRAKLLLSVGCLIFLTLLTSTGIQIYALKRDYLEAVSWRSEALAQDMLNDLKNMLAHSTNTQGLLAAKSIQCMELYELNKDRNVSHFAIISADGTIVAHNDKTLWNTVVKNAALLEAVAQQNLTTVLTEGSYHTLIPIFGPQDSFVGMIDVGFPAHIVDQKLRHILFKAAEVLSLAWILAFFTISSLIQVLVIKPLGNIMAIMKDVEEGNLDVKARVVAHDEIGLLATRLNQMIEHLRLIVIQVQRSGLQVTSSSTELSATAKEQEVIVTRHLESMSHIAASIKEISEVSTQLVETVQHVALMSEDTAEFANKGQTNLEHMKGAMNRMEHASLSISNRLKSIHEKADNITTVVTTITRVADQTNLLSLNAAIEAEKAGEYGRGFTVVASEIRRLADQTAVATLDIEEMVGSMQTAVSAGVIEMDQFITEVHQSAKDVGNISVQLSGIIEQVQAISPRFEEVNLVMGTQSEHARTITRAMAQLDDEMQQTKESLHETYAAIEQLNETSRNLRHEVSRFKVTVT